MDEQSLPPAHRLRIGQLKSRLRLAMILALGGLTCLPLYFYQYRIYDAKMSMTPHEPRQVLMLALGQAIMLVLAGLLSAMVGLLYADKLSLPGLGKKSELKWWALAAVAAGLAMTPVSWHLADRRLFADVPETFFRPWWWALAHVWGNAYQQELVARLGLLTIGVYFLRWFGWKGHPWPAILVVCLFAVMSSFIFYQRFQLTGRIELSLLHLSIASTVAFQWLYGEVYVRRGFGPALILHLGLNLKMVIYSFFLPPH